LTNKTIIGVGSIHRLANKRYFHYDISHRLPILASPTNFPPPQNPVFYEA